MRNDALPSIASESPRSCGGERSRRQASCSLATSKRREQSPSCVSRCSTGPEGASMTALITETPTSRTANTLDRKTLWLWAASFLGLPIGGYVAHLIVGPIDATWVAVAAGAITGAIVGAAQWFAL